MLGKMCHMLSFRDLQPQREQCRILLFGLPSGPPTQGIEIRFFAQFLKIGQTVWDPECTSETKFPFSFVSFLGLFLVGQRWSLCCTSSDGNNNTSVIIMCSMSRIVSFQDWPFWGSPRFAATFSAKGEPFRLFLPPPRPTASTAPGSACTAPCSRARAAGVVAEVCKTG